MKRTYSALYIICSFVVLLQNCFHCTALHHQHPSRDVGFLEGEGDRSRDLLHCVIRNQTKTRFCLPVLSSSEHLFLQWDQGCIQVIETVLPCRPGANIIKQLKNMCLYCAKRTVCLSFGLKSSFSTSVCLNIEYLDQLKENRVPHWFPLAVDPLCALCTPAWTALCFVLRCFLRLYQRTSGNP